MFLTSEPIHIFENFSTTMANFLKFPQTGLTYLPLSAFSLTVPFPSLPVERICHLSASGANSLKTLPGFLSNQKSISLFLGALC